MLEILQSIIDSFGAIIVFPIILIVIELFLKVPFKKAFVSGLSAGVGLQGFYLLIGAYSGVIDPIINNMVTQTGINLPAYDVGWQASAAIAYATNVGMMFMPVALILGFVLFFIKFTDIFQPSDLWNNYAFMIWGSMCYLVTGNYWVSMALMVFMFFLHLTTGEVTEKRWSVYYNFPGCTHCSLFNATNTWLFIGLNWIMDRLGLYKIQADPKSLKQKLSVFGDPMVLGFFIGLLIGLLGYFTQLTTLSAWGSALTCAVSTAAIMAVFPRIASIFAGAFAPLTQASSKLAKNRKGNFYLNVNDAVAYGETANLISGLLAIPLVLIAAFVLPGNIVLPLVSLPSIPYSSEFFTALANGNVVKSTIATTIFFIMCLYVAGSCAEMFTQVALTTGYTLTTGVALITSFGTDIGNPSNYLITLAFMSQNYLLIGGMVVAYLLLHVIIKKNKPVIQDWIEWQALHPGEKFQRSQAQPQEQS